MPDTTIARPTPESVAQRLAEAGLDVPAACIPGTVANLIVLQEHMETLRALPLDDRCPIALEYRT